MKTDKKEVDEREDKRICRALITPSEESEDFDFEAVAVPVENGQLKYSYMNDEYFNQVLRTGSENINAERLESGLPIFDNHPWEQSAMNTLGVTVEYKHTDKGLVCRCKLGARADQALRDDIKNGVIKSVSIEGDIESYEIKREAGKIPTYYAELWTPTSLSFAPVPNDIGASIEVKRALEKQINKSTEIEKTEHISNIKSTINKF